MRFRHQSHPSRRQSSAIARRCRLSPFLRRLGFEPLEDRRLLSAYTVDSLDDIVAADGLITLREALEAANTNAQVFDAAAGSPTETDVISFDSTLFADGPARIALANGELLIVDDVDIEGPGAESLIIDAQRNSRVFYLKQDIEGAISGLTITGGSGPSLGSGIYNLGTLTVTNSTIWANSAGAIGGGIYNRQGTLTVTNSTISANSAEGGGGGIYSSGTLTVKNSTISGNSAGWDQGDEGGGIYNGQGTLTVTNSTISDNSAGDSGGGIYNYLGTLTVTNSTLSGNSATGDGTSSGGGGIYNNSGTLTVTNSTISDNSGSGIYTGSSRAVTVTNSTISGNSGGGIHNRSTGEVSVTNSTIAGNSGGGIDNVGPLRLANSIVANNSNSPFYSEVYGSFSDGSDHNLIGILTDQQRQTAGEHTLSGSSDQPLDPVLSELADLGSGQWGYYPLPGSPALDAGDPNFDPNTFDRPLTADQAGGPRVENGTVDIGAVEGSPDVTIPAVTYVVESFDRTTAADGVLTFWEALEAATGNRPVGDAPAGSPHEQDRIEFAATCPDTLVLEGEPITLQANLAIVAPQSKPITVDARGNSRVFEILAESRVMLEGLTISGGRASDGGGIFNYHGRLTVTNSTISANSAEGGGGGIYSSGTLTVKNSTISGNSAGWDQGDEGGGIYNRQGTLTMTNSTISGNSAGWGQGDRGGGIYNYLGTLTVTNSTISGNSGVGINSVSDSTLTIANSIISNNSSGGMTNYQGTVTITDSTISDHLGGGHGISNGNGTMSIANSTISGNSGGGIFNGGTLNITDAIISGNSVSAFDGSYGGGIHNLGRSSTP